MNDLRTQHVADYVRIYDVKHPTVVSTQATLDNFLDEEVVLIPEPFIFVENPIAREDSAYNGISSETLKKYMCVLKNFIMLKK